MAGDWIKIEHTLPEKPEVDRLSDDLGIAPDEIVGKLVRLWVWADQHSLDGNAVSVTEKSLDRRAGLPGFAAALRKVGWLEGRDAALSFPNFSRHNGQTAKSRALTKNRVDKSRGANCNAPGVTEALPEKRREEIDERERRAGVKFPTEEQAKAHGATRTPPAEESFSHWWWSSMEGSGWHDDKDRPVHPTRWKHVYNASYAGARHNEATYLARFGPPKTSGPRGTSHIPNIN